MKNWQLFLIFFQIGIATIGGGYAMIPLLEYKIVKQHKWLSQADFLDILALSQSAPGIFAVNLSQLIGQRLGGCKASLSASLGVILPSFIIILLLATVFTQVKDNIWIEYAFTAMRPVVVALIVSAVYSLIKGLGLGLFDWIIILVVTSAIYIFKLHPAYVLLGSVSMAYIIKQL